MKKYSKFVLTMLVFIFSDIFILIPVLLFNIDVDSMSDSLSTFLSAIASIILSIILFYLYRNDIKKMFVDFKNNFKKYFMIGYKYWLIGIVLMAVSNVILNIIFDTGSSTNEELVQSTIKAYPILALFLTSFIAPFTEEIAFRLSFTKIIKNELLYVIVAGASFGLLHVVFSSSSLGEYLYFIPYSCLGASLALMYTKTKNVFTPMFMHFCHNFIFTLISIIGYLL